MKKELNEIIVNEIDAVENLLKALEIQHNCLVKSDAITIENCTAEIEKCNKDIAAWEMKRRELTQGRAMSEIINNIDDNEIHENYRKIKKLLEEVKVQKDTNELLIKQGLSFTNRVINILNPSRTAKTYNSYGKVSR